MPLKQPGATNPHLISEILKLIMMKKLLLALSLSMGITAHSQTYISIATDTQGDDHYADAKELAYRLNSAKDTLFIKIEHYNARGNDFGYAIALDTNTNPNDGFLMSQGNLKNQTPNTSMKYDIALYVYQNGFFPGVYTEAYGSDGMATTLPFDYDTTDQNSIVFALPLNSIGGNLNMNILAFTGSFDINPSGAGPGDVMPDNSFTELRTNTIGVEELAIAEFFIYPNPASSYIHLKNIGNMEVVQLRDMSGKILKEVNPQTDQGFDVRNISSGLYTLTSPGFKSIKVLIK